MKRPPARSLVETLVFTSVAAMAAACSSGQGTTMTMTTVTPSPKPTPQAGAAAKNLGASEGQSADADAGKDTDPALTVSNHSAEADALDRALDCYEAIKYADPLGKGSVTRHERYGRLDTLNRGEAEGKIRYIFFSPSRNAFAVDVPMARSGLSKLGGTEFWAVFKDGILVGGPVDSNTVKSDKAYAQYPRFKSEAGPAFSDADALSLTRARLVYAIPLLTGRVSGYVRGEDANLRYLLLDFLSDQIWRLSKKTARGLYSSRIPLDSDVDFMVPLAGSSLEVIQPAPGSKPIPAKDMAIARETVIRIRASMRSRLLDTDQKVLAFKRVYAKFMDGMVYDADPDLRDFLSMMKVDRMGENFTLELKAFHDRVNAKIVAAASAPEFVDKVHQRGIAALNYCSSLIQDPGIQGMIKVEMSALESSR